MNAQEAGMAIIEEMAEPKFVETVKRLSEDEDYTWIFDPDCVGVVGLVERGTNKALVVVWTTEKDFEYDYEKVGY